MCNDNHKDNNINNLYVNDKFMWINTPDRA